MKVPRRGEESNGEINYKTQWTIIILVTTTITTLGLLQHSANIMILTDHHSIAISLSSPPPCCTIFLIVLSAKFACKCTTERDPLPPSLPLVINWTIWWQEYICTTIVNFTFRWTAGQSTDLLYGYKFCFIFVVTSLVFRLYSLVGLRLNWKPAVGPIFNLVLIYLRNIIYLY